MSGIDMYAPEGTTGIQFYSGDIFDNRLGKYNMITFHHSFEHMMEPDLVLKRAKELLVDKTSKIVIRIPIGVYCMG